MKAVSSKIISKSNFQSIPRQSARLEERKVGDSYEIERCGMRIVVNQGVYQTSVDTDLMAECVKISNGETFVEIGCGTGAVAIAVAKRAKNGVGVDINDKAIENSKQNAEAQGVRNIEFLESDVFENVSGKFDVIICNPPYTKHEVSDNIDRMFWDPEDEMKYKFFREVGAYLKPNGRIFFGWANFGDIDVDIPFKLADKNGFALNNTYSRSHKDNVVFYVLEFIRKNSSAYFPPQRTYAEIGFGNETFLSTEIEHGDKEYRLAGFLRPMFPDDYYVRLWIGKKVLIISTKTGIKIKKKERKAFKFLFGIGGNSNQL